MPAHFVYVCQEVIDRDELETYWSKIDPTLDGNQPRSIAAYTPFQQLGATAWTASRSSSSRPPPSPGPGTTAPATRRSAITARPARTIGLLGEGGALPPEQRMPHRKDRSASTAKAGASDA